MNTLDSQPAVLSAVLFPCLMLLCAARSPWILSVKLRGVNERVCFLIDKAFNSDLLVNQETQQDKGGLRKTLFLLRISKVGQSDQMVVWVEVLSFIFIRVMVFWGGGGGVEKECFKEVFEKHFLQMFIASEIPFLSLYLLQNTARLPTKEGLCSQEFSAFLSGVGIFLSYKGPLANSL